MSGVTQAPVAKFVFGDVVELSDEGRKEIPQLRRRKGTIAARGIADHVWVVVWGTGIVMHNHEDNLQLFGERLSANGAAL